MLPKMSFLDSFDEFDGGVYEAHAEQTQMDKCRNAALCVICSGVKPFANLPE